MYTFYRYPLQEKKTYLNTMENIFSFIQKCGKNRGILYIIIILLLLLQNSAVFKPSESFLKIFIKIKGNQFPVSEVKHFPIFY